MTTTTTTTTTTKMKNELGYEMVESLEDLLGRLLVASERKISRSVEPDEAVWMLGLPYPADATNDHLRTLQRLYVALLQNDPVLDRLLNMSEEEDQAIPLLYFLEFPFMVLCARKDKTGLLQCQNQQDFEITEIARRILCHAKILSFCRTVIAPHNTTCSASLITSALGILNSLSDALGILSNSKAKKMIQRHVYRHESFNDGFLELRDDLATLLSSHGNNPKPQMVANAILVQWELVGTVAGRDMAPSILGSAPQRDVFEQAVLRVRDQLDPMVVLHLLQRLGSCDSDTTVRSSSSPSAPRAVYVCGNGGCRKKTTKRCDQCKCVGYCSRECQVADWKAGHKKVCNKSKSKKQNDKKIGAAAAETRDVTSPALAKQNELLQKNPGFDYVIVLPEGKHDMGVQLGIPDIKAAFGCLRSQAPQDPQCVSTMYKFLHATHPLHKEIIRKQLLAEYGVDPETLLRGPSLDEWNNNSNGPSQQVMEVVD
ncbi:expressed unknown protein [Seminavis robusta]|uniref:phytol kinase n=1 Tax=Seminavis robusta TaxID=568900 RepID=A0A9N8H425_9STRA|nr:expressed unknown protein [Seminavis robusta]|eukprot:Sro39_g024340.1 n/a (485) ;mRNA; f:142598-144052